MLLWPIHSLAYDVHCSESSHEALLLYNTHLYNVPQGHTSPAVTYSLDIGAQTHNTKDAL
jgi:hypothetical protein